MQLLRVKFKPLPQQWQHYRSDPMQRSTQERLKCCQSKKTTLFCSAWGHLPFIAQDKTLLPWAQLLLRVCTVSVPSAISSSLMGSEYHLCSLWCQTPVFPMVDLPHELELKLKIAQHRPESTQQTHTFTWDLKLHTREIPRWPLIATERSAALATKGRKVL